MHKYGHDKKAQEWIDIKQPKPSRFERKVWQISICICIAVFVMVADAIAGGF